jgi:hypothetical protein
VGFRRDDRHVGFGTVLAPQGKNPLRATVDPRPGNDASLGRCRVRGRHGFRPADGDTLSDFDSDPIPDPFADFTADSIADSVADIVADA